MTSFLASAMSQRLLPSSGSVRRSRTAYLSTSDGNTNDSAGFKSAIAKSPKGYHRAVRSPVLDRNADEVLRRLVRVPRVTGLHNRLAREA